MLGVTACFSIPVHPQNSCNVIRVTVQIKEVSTLYRSYKKSSVITDTEYYFKHSYKLLFTSTNLGKQAHRVYLYHMFKYYAIFHNQDTAKKIKTTS